MKHCSLFSTVKITSLLLVGALILVVNAPIHADEPRLEIDERGNLVPELPGTPMPTFELRYAADVDWPGDDNVRSDLEARGWPELIEILSIDSTTRTVRLRTTRYAAGHSFSTLPAEMVLITDADEELKCAKVYAVLNLENEPREGDPTGTIWARWDGDCPASRRVDWLRHVMVEGIDADGAQAFLVVVKDPRWYLHETFSDDGVPRFHGMGKRKWPDVGLIIRAPVDDELTTLRVWELDEDNQFRLLGDIPWGAPEWK